MREIEIVPAILTKDPFELQQKLESLEGIAPKVQIDVVDGVFAANKTFDLAVLKNFEHSLKMDLHLMVKQPIDWISRSRDVVADRVIAQVEMMADINKFLEEVATSGMEVGLALDLETTIEKIPVNIYPQLDSVLLMAVHAGFSGQQFDTRVLAKIEKVREILGDLVEIAVDGGLNEENILKCKEAGANIFYVTSAFWVAEDLRRRYEELEELIK